MKQIIQSYKTGELQLVEVPAPALKKGFILVRNISSLLSVGTEKYMLEMAKKSLLGKALARRDLVKQVIAKARAEGLFEAYKAAMTRLDNPVPLGYSCAGVVVEVAPADGEEFKVGDRVACAGSGYASHGEVVSVPQNLCIKIPDNVSFEAGSFIAIGGIALESIRLANPLLGDRVAVIGLGLLGQITVQLLRANGCHVFGIDISEEKVKMALENGAEKAAISGKEDVLNSSKNYAPKGFDSVIIMAASKSNKPLEMAAEIARERAKIIAAGLVGLDIPRKIFFEKELDLAVSRAWGPGVFDPLYTDKNIDYPYAYARWTSKRNLEEFIYQLSKGSVKVKHLTTHRFPIDKALEAYELILDGKEPYMGVIIEYPSKRDQVSIDDYKSYKKKIILRSSQHITNNNGRRTPCVGVIGAGLFATGTLLPILKKTKDLRLRGVATATGMKGQHIAKKFGFEYFTTDYRELLNDSEINLLFILTRHGSHAQFVTEALKAGKHVFVEKPLCINKEQLNQIIDCYQLSAISHQLLVVGFNRRFSPFTRWLKDRFAGVAEPLSVHCTINAEPIPPGHWVHDPEEGGGRIIGEGCHFVDLIQYLTGSVPIRVYAETLTSSAGNPGDNVHINLKMANGAVGSINYLSGGDKRYPRERVEVFGGGAVGVIDNFKAATFTRGGRRSRKRSWIGVDRGHRGEVDVLFDAIHNAGTVPVGFEEYVYTTMATFAIQESMRNGKPIAVNPESLEKIKDNANPSS